MIVTGIVVVASTCIADSGGSSPKPAGDLAALRADLRLTRAPLELVVNRTSALEKQVRALGRQRSNAELQQAMEKIGKPGPIPVH